MKETKEKLQKICEMKENITTFAKSVIEGDKADLDSAGKLVDMIKDLAKAEKDCWEACYYKTVVEAMTEGDDERAGYDHYRYASGRFAPTGHGHRSGYIPEESFHDHRMWERENGRLGYPNSNDGSGSNGMRGMGSGSRGNSGNRSGYSDEYGSSYGRYRDSRRHYHESRSQADKEEMSHHAKEYLAESISTMREIWADADPDMKKKMKEELSGLCKELGM